MKRLIAIMLVILVCISLLAGCTGNGQTDVISAVFSVGFGQIDITPTESVPMDGYDGANSPANRWSKSTELPLEANCVAFSDVKGATVLLITLDLLHAYNALEDTIRSEIAKETDVPKENIFLHCTHNHSGPALRGADYDQVTNYLAHLMDNVTIAVKNALDDRKPAQMYTTFTRPENCSFVRHYLLSDGTYLSSPGSKLPEGTTYYGQATNPDNLLQLVKFTRDGGKDVVMVNWQGHPCASIDKSVINSDYPGALRDYLETNLNCDAVFILGGSGNMVTTTLLPETKQYADYRQYAQVLGTAAVEATTRFMQHTPKELSVTNKELSLETRDGGVRKMQFSAFSVGDFAMVTAPLETFDTNAVTVKENSPYLMTFYASCTNGSNGYLPTADCYDWQQNYEARITNFPRGTSEIVQDTQLTILNDLFEQEGRAESEKPDDYVRGAYLPQSDGVTYENPAVGSAMTLQPLNNGFYSILLSDGNHYKTYMIKNEEVANEIIALDKMQLLFDESNVVVGVVK